MWKLFNIFLNNNILGNETEVLKFMAKDSDTTNDIDFNNSVSYYIYFITGALTMIYIMLVWFYAKYLPGTYTIQVLFLSSPLFLLFVNRNLTAAYRVATTKRIKEILPSYEHFEGTDQRVLQDSIKKAVQLNADDDIFSSLVSGFFDKQQEEVIQFIEKSLNKDYHHGER